MKYISIDLETTGLDPKTCQVIEVAMVLEDTENIRPIDELPFFHALIRHSFVKGEWEAIEMNWELINEASNSHDEDYVWSMARQWLFERSGPDGERFFLAGKNVGTFDYRFLPESVQYCFHHRTIDPGSVFMDWHRGPPSLGVLTGTEVKHRALEDARDVVRVLRRAYEPQQQLPLVPAMGR